MRIFKIILSALIIAAVHILNPIGVYSEWNEDDTGWSYKEEDSSLSAGWEQIDGKWYYFDKNGYMKTGWVQDNDKWYYLYNDGSMATNTTIDNYTVDSNGAWIQSDSVNSKEDIREITYNLLSEDKKKYIKGTWKDGTVSEVTLNEEMGSINDKSYIGKKVYIVNFNLNIKSSPNNMIVYVGEDNYKIIGYGYVE